MYGYGYRYNSGLVIGAGGGGGGFTNTFSLNFDGVDDEVNCGNDSSLQNPNFTVSVWVYPTSTSGTNVIVQNTTGAFGSASYGFRVVRVFSNYIFYIGDGSGNNVFQISSAASLNTWQNLVMTYNGTNAKYYLDGVLKGTAAVSNISYGVSPYNNFYIGTKGGSQRFTGNIDEVALWDSALTDISSIYNGGTPTDLTSLSPIAWYRMGDNGSWKSPQWLIPSNENKDKVSNYTFQLDGINDYIDCGDSDVFSFGDGATDSAFSVSTWFKMSSFNTNNVVFSKDSGLPSREYAIGFFGASKKLRFYIKDNGGNNQQSIDSTTLFTTDTWYNITCTYDGSGGSNAADGMNIYVNSVLETPTNVIKGTYTAMSNTTAPVNIGRYGAAASFLPATVDEVSVYDSELLQADVTDIYNGGEPTAISGAIAHYKMGENATLLTEWTIPDEVGSNNGASVNMNFLDRIGEAPNSSNNALSYNMDLVDRVTDVP